MKRLLIMLILLVVLLTGCGNSPEVTELWVVTELDETGMNPQIELLAEQFEAEHPGITVRLDILPTAEESRAAYLQAIRAEVMAGNGPDVYLMPTAAQSPPQDETLSTPYLEPLYRDVVIQMYNGIFTDIREYYDADPALSGTLVDAVMDAGVMDGARYILPLRYTYDALLVDLDAMEGKGIDPAEFDGGVDALYQLAIQMNDEIAAHALNVTPSWYMLSETVDHRTGNVLIDPEETENLIRDWQDVVKLENAEAHQDVLGYFIGAGYLPIEDGYPGYTYKINDFTNGAKRTERFFTYSGYSLLKLNLSNCIEAAATVKQSGENIAMIPVRAADGSLVAEITYYGAVGSGCRDPKLAYEFLRMFLTEDAQWEQYSSRNDLLEVGFPVRTEGFAEVFYEKTRTQLELQQKQDIFDKYYNHIQHREKFIDKSFVITDADVPLFGIPIDEARFPVMTANGEYFSQHLDSLAQSDDLSGQISIMLNDLQWLITES